jgi:hypothetical protein
MMRKTSKAMSMQGTQRAGGPCRAVVRGLEA